MVSNMSTSTQTDSLLCVNSSSNQEQMSTLWEILLQYILT